MRLFRTGLKCPSVVIEAMGYAPLSQTLVVRFRSGAVYEYAHVPPALVRLFRRSQSKGKFFNALIRGRYAVKIYEREREYDARRV